MPDTFTTSDIVLSLLVLFGMVQLAWFSVMIIRRGAPPLTIQQAIPPLFSIWILMWPVYNDLRWLWLNLLTLFILSAAAIYLKSPFWAHLRVAWSPGAGDLQINSYSRPSLMPLTHILASIFISALWFQAIPEFGFGLALCFSIAFPLAYWVDQIARIKFSATGLGFPAHPDQTLIGHIALMISIALLLSWAIHVYHATNWSDLLIATLIAAMAASATRAVIPGHWNVPAAMITTGLTMWLL